MDRTWDEGRMAWLALASFDGFGAKTLYKLWALFGMDGAHAWDEVPRHLASIGCQVATIERFRAYRERCDPRALADGLTRNGMAFLRHDDLDFPFLLTQIADPPFALFVRGTLPASPRHPIAVVGTRHMSAYGKEVAMRIGGDLAANGATVVSGLALGIDAMAHRAALARGGPCIAVLGSGIDDAACYPRANLGLARDILAAGGAVISEHPPGTPGLKHHFPLRNRTIAGLATATVVIEAATGSGSLITAHLALQYDRDVFAVPGPITDARSSGCNKLLSLGARVCTSAADILPVQTVAATAPPPLPPDLDEDEKRVLDALREPTHIDGLARGLGMPVRDLAAHLSSLELQGCIEARPGEVYARVRGS